MSDTKYGMPIETEDDRGMPEKSIILHTCSRITDNLAAGRPTFDGCDDAGLTELVAQIQVEQFERDENWPGDLDRPDLAAFNRELQKACPITIPGKMIHGFDDDDGVVF